MHHLHLQYWALDEVSRVVSNLDEPRQFLCVSHTMIGRVTICDEPCHQFCLFSCVVNGFFSRCRCNSSLEVGCHLTIPEDDSRIMTIRSGPVDKTLHWVRFNAIVHWRLPVLCDPDLSMWFWQIEMTNGVVELSDEQCVGFMGLRLVIGHPTVHNRTLFGHELLLTSQPVLEIEVSDTQDDLQFAMTLLSRVDINQVDLWRDAVIIVVDVFARPH